MASGTLTAREGRRHRWVPRLRAVVPIGSPVTGGTPLPRILSDVRRGPGRDRGASTLELALLTPVLIMVILFVMQFAMVYHARHVALAAAQAGARTARESGRADWKASAEAKARTSVAQIGPNLLTGMSPRAGGDRNQRWVVVTGYAVQVAPFFKFRVTERSGGPIECYRPDVGSGTNCTGP